MKLAMNDIERFLFVNRLAHEIAGAFHTKAITRSNKLLAIGLCATVSHRRSECHIKSLDEMHKVTPARNSFTYA
jgi:hypothetical protein